MSAAPLCLPACALGDWSPDAARAVLAEAQVLKRAGRCASGALRGPPERHVAVLCEARFGASAQVFAQAATRLGASVVYLRPSLAWPGEAAGAREWAHALGRLYAAIGCDAVAPERLAQLAQTCGVPVFSNVAQAAHPTRLLGDAMTLLEQPPAGLADGRLCLGVGPHARQLAAWQLLASWLPLQLQVMPCWPAQTRDPGPQPAPSSLAFFYQPAHDLTACAPSVLWAINRHTGARRALLGAQIENHGYVVQAMLALGLG